MLYSYKPDEDMPESVPKGPFLPKTRKNTNGATSSQNSSQDNKYIIGLEH